MLVLPEQLILNIFVKVLAVTVKLGIMSQKNLLEIEHISEKVLVVMEILNIIRIRMDISEKVLVVMAELLETPRNDKNL